MLIDRSTGKYSTKNKQHTKKIGYQKTRKGDQGGSLKDEKDLNGHCLEKRHLSQGD